MMALIVPTQQINVVAHEGHVVIQFSRPVQELILTPQNAAELARAIAGQTEEIIKFRVAIQ